MGLKLGVQEKKWKIYAAGGLGIAVLGLAIYNLKDSFGGSAPPPTPPPASVAQAPARHSTPSNGTHEATKLASTALNLDPTLHPELMAQAESLEYTGNGRNIFSLTSVPVDIPKPIKTAAANAGSQHRDRPTAACPAAADRSEVLRLLRPAERCAPRLSAQGRRRLRRLRRRRRRPPV